MKNNSQLEDLVRCGLEARPDFMFARKSLRFCVTLRRHTMPCKSINERRQPRIRLRAIHCFTSYQTRHSLLQHTLYSLCFSHGFSRFSPSPFLWGPSPWANQSIHAAKLRLSRTFLRRCNPAPTTFYLKSVSLMQFP